MTAFLFAYATIVKNGGFMQNFLQENLTVLTKKNPQLAGKLLNNNSQLTNFSFVYTQNSEAILVKDGMVLNNPVDPVNEAIKTASVLTSNNQKDTCFVIGMEVGYLFSYLANNYLGSIILFEPCLDTLKLAFQMVDYSKALSRENVYIANDDTELNSAIQSSFQKGGQVSIVANEHYSKKHAGLIQNLYPQLKELWMDPYTGGDIKLNIGAGNWAVKGWRTLDCYRDADFYVDLREMEKLEIEDNKIEKVFSSHCFEHLTDDNLKVLFKELNRCLKPGGVFRFSCPDADKALEAYKNNDTSWFNWVKQGPIGEMLLNVFVSYEWMAGGPKESEEVIREKFETLDKKDFIKWCVSLKDESRPYIAHTNGLYFDKLKEMLEEAGFKNIKRSTFKGSQDEELRNDAFDMHEPISIYMECTK